MKKETIEEYLARGGKITKVPANVVVDTGLTVKIQSGPDNGSIMSLDDGAFYFSESRSVKKDIKKLLLNDIVDNYNLPVSVVNRLRGLNE